MYHPYYDRNPYGGRGLCICPSHPMTLAPSYTRGTYPGIQQDQEKIYVRGMDGTIIPFPLYTKYISEYISTTLNFSKDKGTEDDPIVIGEPSFLLQIISRMISALSDAARDIYGKPVAITHVVYPEVTFSEEGKEDVSKSIILVNPLVKKAIQPYIPLVGTTINNKALRDLTGIADYLEIPSLTNALSSYIADQVFYYMRPFITPNATPENLLPNLKTVLLHDNLDGPSYPLSNPILISILKHLKLKKLGVVERSIADYIGENGQPKVVKGHHSTANIHLTKKGITGLIGLDLILPKKEVTRLELTYNHILGDNFDQGILGKRLFKEWKSLSNIGLGSNQLQCLPEGFFNGLTALMSLSLNDNQLHALPGNLFNGLTALKYLYLNHNQLQVLPESIFHDLTALQLLNLSKNKFQLLPENIFKGLIALEKLHLHNNNLQLLKENVFNGLISLEKLHLDYNELQSLPNNLFKGLTALKYLYLNHNQLQTLKEKVFQGLTILKKLSLEHNQLQLLSERVFQELTTLEELYLEQNQLRLLSENIFQGLTALQCLNLGHNQLQLLSEKVFKSLTALDSLYIEYNFLPGNDEQFINHYNLQHVDEVLFDPQHTHHQPITNWYRNHSYSKVQNTLPPMMPYRW